jgi:hypothetical protein
LKHKQKKSNNYSERNPVTNGKPKVDSRGGNGADADQEVTLTDGGLLWKLGRVFFGWS